MAIFRHQREVLLCGIGISGDIEEHAWTSMELRWGIILGYWCGRPFNIIMVKPILDGLPK